MGSLPDDLRFRCREGVLVREIEGQAVVLDLHSRQYFSLNETGLRVWQLLSRGDSLGAMLAALQVEFDAPPELQRSDVEELLASLEGAGLVARLEPTANR